MEILFATVTGGSLIGLLIQLTIDAGRDFGLPSFRLSGGKPRSHVSESGRSDSGKGYDSPGMLTHFGAILPRAKAPFTGASSP